jgi:predicted SAM-dependent methyltransferase
MDSAEAATSGEDVSVVLMRAIRQLSKHLARGPLALRNRRRVAALQRDGSLRLHLGCGDDSLTGFINVDYRQTQATDVVMDLALPRLAAGSVALAFSHAFFEHLYRNARLPHLQRIRQSLEPGGVCCYIGIPYFRNIARFYLEGAPGIVGPSFDLFNVYRYTHGDPEHAPSWWLGQLHKSLFDEPELDHLLRESGFQSFVQFTYVYPGEPQEVPVSMGFYATSDGRGRNRLREDCTSFLACFDTRKISLDTIAWLGEKI